MDELLVLLREQIGLGIGEPGEVAAERLPEVAGAVGLERRQQLGQHLVAKERAVHAPMKRKRTYESNLPSALGSLAGTRAADQAADLGRAVVVVADAQERVDEVLVERLRVVLFVDDVEVDVRRVARVPSCAKIIEVPMIRSLSGRRARRRTRACCGSLTSPAKLRSREIDDLANRVAIVGQVDRVEVPRDGGGAGLRPPVRRRGSRS